MQQARHLLAAAYTTRSRNAYVVSDIYVCDARTLRARRAKTGHCAAAVTRIGRREHTTVAYANGVCVGWITIVSLCSALVHACDGTGPWVNNCVGEYNQKYFVQFLIYVGAASVYCLSLVACAWVWPCTHQPCPDVRHMSPIYHTKV